MKQGIKKRTQGLTLLLALVLSVVFFSCAIGTDGSSENGGISLNFEAGSKALGGGKEARYGCIPTYFSAEIFQR
jgi:hypothetical protein